MTQREYTTPAVAEIPSVGNLTDAVVDNARTRPQHVVFSRKNPFDGRWYDITCAEFHAQVVQVAKGFIAQGVGAGDRIAIFARTRYEWSLMDYALWFAGAISVPIYETSSAEQILWVISDAEVQGVVAEDADFVARVRAVSADLDIRHFWSIEDGAVADLTEAGSEISDETLESRRSAATPDSIATLIYTSGTTGRPRGCMITHGNFMFELGQAVVHLSNILSTGNSSLLFLPLAHVFARIIEIGCIMSGTRLGHMSTTVNLVDELKAFRPTFLLGVPRVFEKVYNSAQQTAEAAGRGRVFALAANVAIAWSKGKERGHVPLHLRVMHALFTPLVYRRLTSALGGQCGHAVSGGAALGERLGHFFHGAGITVYEGYGLTETTAAIAANRPDGFKIGTVGRPFGGTSVKVTDDDELLYRGGQVFVGYWHNEEATAEAFDEDGWFHSGDLGMVDDDGFITITGRRKEILVTSNGKNIAPSQLEDRLNMHRLIALSLVVGDGRPYVAALLTVDEEVATRWATHRGKPTDIPSLIADADFMAEIEQSVKQSNEAVSRAESIRRFRVLPEQWTIEGGQVTPKMSIRRAVLTAQYADTIEALYA